tara:strand:- start:1603 stop:2343 length:741 start_codon:yes stop_codon:yes gene_type:complete
MEPKFKLPTETVDLPSKGLFYPEGSPISSGVIEMKYMTAREEDILTNQNYIQKGVVIDKLLQSLIVTEGVDYNSLLSGDKNAIMIAARILAYGKDYIADIRGTQVTIDLTELNNNEIDESSITRGKNEFSFSLPNTDNIITFKLLDHKDEKSIEREIAGLQKINKDNITSSTTRLKHLITSVNGSTDKKDIREFVDKFLLAKDARAIREEYRTVNPDVDLTVYPEGFEEGVDLPITVGFFWPDSRL